MLVMPLRLVLLVLVLLLVLLLRLRRLRSTATAATAPTAVATATTTGTSMCNLRRESLHLLVQTEGWQSAPLQTEAVETCYMKTRGKLSVQNDEAEAD